MFRPALAVALWLSLSFADATRAADDVVVAALARLHVQSNSTENESVRAATAASWYMKPRDGGRFECCEMVNERGALWSALAGEKEVEVCGCPQCPEYKEDFMTKVCEADNNFWDCIHYDHLRSGDGCRNRPRD